MPKYKKRTWKEHQELLEYLIDHSIKQASQHFHKSDGAIRTWLWSIRKKLKEEQTALNRIRNLQRISPRIRKLTTIGTVEDGEEDEA